MTRLISRVAIAAAVVSVTAVLAQAQQTSTSSETKTFEVLAVDGNTLVVRLPEGTRELVVADDFRFTVNGQQLSVQQLKPGMKGTATVTTRTTVTPVTVTEVKNGTVLYQTGMSIIVRTEEGIKQFTQADVDKRGVKIMRSGKPATITDFRQGDQLSATIITSRPPQVMTEREVQATLAAAGGTAGAGGASAPVAAAGRTGSGTTPAAAKQASASSAAGGGARTLPKTASTWPLLGLASVLSIGLGLALTIRRRVTN